MSDKTEKCEWCHSSPCTCPTGWPEAPQPVNISEADLRGVFGHKCDQPNCSVCYPDMSLTELAELYERAASPRYKAALRGSHTMSDAPEIRNKRGQPMPTDKPQLGTCKHVEAIDPTGTCYCVLCGLETRQPLSPPSTPPIDSHKLGFCCRYACGETCVGCGDAENGQPLSEEQ